MKIYLTLKDDAPVPSDYIPVIYTAAINLPNGSCDEIFCDIIENIPNKTEYLTTILPKLKHGGCLVIKAVDLYKVCYSLVFGTLDIANAKKLLYENKLETNTMYEIKNILTTNNMMTIQQIYDADYQFIIRAEKL